MVLRKVESSAETFPWNPGIWMIQPHLLAAAREISRELSHRLSHDPLVSRRAQAPSLLPALRDGAGGAEEAAAGA